MKKTYQILTLLLACTMAFCLSGCYKDELAELHKEVEQIRDVLVPSLSEQVAKVQESLDEFNKTRDDLDDYVKLIEQSNAQTRKDVEALEKSLEALENSAEGELSSLSKDYASTIKSIKEALSSHFQKVSQTAEALKAKQAVYEKQLEELKATFDGKFAEKSWVEGTMATLAKQQEIVATLEGINALKNTLDASISGLKAKMEGVIDGKLNDAAGQFSGLLKQESDKVLKLCDDQVKALASAIESDCAKALSDSLAANEKAIKAWFGEAVSGYLTVVQANARIAAFNSIVGNVPTGKSLQAQIEEMSAYLKRVNEALVEEYIAAFEKAVEELGGRISASVVSRLNALIKDKITPLTEQISSFENTLNELFSKVDGFDKQINSIDGQSEKISSSLSTMQKMHDSLSSLIKELEKDLTGADNENKAAIQKLINEYSAILGGLDTQIAALTDLIGTFPTGSGATSLTAWIESSLNTLQAQFSTCMVMSKVDAALAKVLSDLNGSTVLAAQKKQIEELTAKLAQDLSVLEGQIKTWLGEELDGYATTAEMTAALAQMKSDLAALYGDADTKLGARIAETEKKLQEEKSKIEEAYKKAIEDAVKNGGYLNDTIAKSIEDATKTLGEYESSIGTLKTDVDDLIERMEALEDNIALLFQQIVGYESFYRTFIAGYETSSLAAIIKSIMDDLGSCGDDVAKFGEDYDAFAKKVYGYKKQVDSLGSMAKNLAQAKLDIDGLKTFFSHETGATLDGILENISNQLKNCVDTSELTAMSKEVKAIVENMEKLDTLVHEMDSLSKSLASAKTFFNGHTDSQGKKLDAILEDLAKEIAALKKLEIFGGTDSALKEKITQTWELLYGKGGSLEKPAKGSLVDRYNLLMLQLSVFDLANSFNTVVYYPEHLDQAATLNVLSETKVTASFKFIVSPAVLAEYLAKADNAGYVKMKWLVYGQAPVAFEKHTIRYADGILTIEVEDSAIAEYANSLVSMHAALFVSVPLEDEKELAFVSDYIPLLPVWKN